MFRSRFARLSFSSLGTSFTDGGAFDRLQTTRSSRWPGVTLRHAAAAASSAVTAATTAAAAAATAATATAFEALARFATGEFRAADELRSRELFNRRRQVQIRIGALLF